MYIMIIMWYLLFYQPIKFMSINCKLLNGIYRLYKEAAPKKIYAAGQ